MALRSGGVDGATGPAVGTDMPRGRRRLVIAAKVALIAVFVGLLDATHALGTLVDGVDEFAQGLPAERWVVAKLSVALIAGIVGFGVAAASRRRETPK